MKKTQRGVVLIIVMLFLSVVSLLVLHLLDSSLLECKMSSYYRNKMQAFYLAEDKLFKAEKEILKERKVLSSSIIDEESICGVVFYKIVASAEEHGVTSVLQSVVARVDNTKKCLKQPKIIPGRQSFLIVK